MRLNADIVFDCLPSSLGAIISGARERGLRLRRPELLTEDTRRLVDDRLYVLTRDQLPRRVEVGRGVVLLVIGSSTRLRWFCEHCCVITVREDADLFATFNAVQRIFERYDLWEQTLYNVIGDDASVQAMLEATQGLIERPMLVIDADFRVIASVGEGTGVEQEDLDLGMVDTFLANHELSTDVKGAFELDFPGQSALSVNLIDDKGYHGCLTVVYPGARPRPGDGPTAEFLASLVLRAFKSMDAHGETEHGRLREAMRALVDNAPVGTVGRTLAETASRRATYVCVRLRLDHRMRQLPLAYVRNMLETDMPGSIAFEYHRASVVAFVAIDDIAPEGERRAALERTLLPLLTSMEMRAGISDHVTSLLEARWFFLQASMALENGAILDPDKRLYRFQTYALDEMVENSLGEMPVEMFYSSGLRRLLAHDAGSATSYVETLRCYLDHNMNVTHTAAALYVHRSTLIERLSRIKDALGENLDDPDVRLRLQLLFKAGKLHERLQRRFDD